jgi:hypothetical protein
VCVVLGAVFRLIVVLFCVMCAICLLCFTVLPLSPGKTPFPVKINNNILSYKILCGRYSSLADYGHGVLMNNILRRM